MAEVNEKMLTGEGLAELWGIIKSQHDGFINEYVWAKTTVELEIPVGSQYNLTLYHPSYPSYNTVYYSDKYTYDEDTKTATLEDYKTLTIDISQTDTTYLQVLRGQYVIGNPGVGKNYAVSSVNNQPSMFRIDDNATFTINSRQLTCGAKTMQFGNIEKNTTVHGYVNSPDPNAYPVDDGYTYMALGQLGAKANVAIGRYIGTGGYGVDNQTVLQTGFVPKFVLISKRNFYAGRISWTFFSYPQQKGLSFKPDSNGTGVTIYIYDICTWDDPFSFYSDNGDVSQMNQAGEEYGYIAIG